MKQTIYPVLVICIIGLIFSSSLQSCRKDKFQPTIKQYDSIQIADYIAKNNLTGFQKDLAGGDTSGIYYKIISPGSGTPMQYSDKVTFVYTEHTIDGLYTIADTLSQHFYDYVGHIVNDGYPLGLQTAVHNDMIYPNAIMRVLIPSHLAYGRDGKGSGSSTVANNKIAGNQCMDMYIHGITNFELYDDQVIQKYMKDSSLTGYTKVLSKLLPGRDTTKTIDPNMPGNYYYYKILKDSVTNDPIQSFSTITCTYTGQLLDGVIFDSSYNGTNTLSTAVSSLVPGVDEGLRHAVAGEKISLLIPSTLAYGIPAYNSIPAFSCLRFTFQVYTVTP